MKYDPAHDEQPVICPSCSWSGTLGQTEDQDVFSPDWEHRGLMCVCPRCSYPISFLEASKAPVPVTPLSLASGEKKAVL